MSQAEFQDPRLVSVYDAECPWSRDDDFFLSVVNETPAARVLDLGCGTGRLTIGMAMTGHMVTGVDPARASLEAARIKVGGERVTWIEGTSLILPNSSFDVAVMTSHVAQFFLEDDEWQQTLSDLKRSLIAGGRLLFDSRDPKACVWKKWNAIDSLRQVAMQDGSQVSVWIEVTAINKGVISFSRHYTFPNGEQLLSAASLRFRTEEEIRSSLQTTGFQVEQIYGGWNHEPVGATDGEFIVVAVA